MVLSMNPEDGGPMKEIGKDNKGDVRKLVKGNACQTRAAERYHEQSPTSKH